MTPLRARLATGLGCALLLAAGAAHGATFTVTSTDDDGAGTLREAVMSANAQAGADTIVFSLPANSTITLATPLDTVIETLEIDGSTAMNLTVRGDGEMLGAVDSADLSVVDLTLQSANIEVGSAALLAFDQVGQAGTFTDVVSGPGALEKRGMDMLVLAGANTYSGGTTVAAGTLQGNTTSLQGNIVNDATLTFDQATDGTFSGAISGTGQLVKQNVGELRLTGNNSYTGGTTVMLGSLRGDTTSLQGDIFNDATLIFDQAFDGTYAGSVLGIPGLGTFQKLGPGNLTVTGTIFNDVRVSAGRLTVSGTGPQQVFGTTTVESGAILSGTVAVQDVIVNGIVAPGDAVNPGQFGGFGTTTFNPGSSLRVRINEVGPHDQYVAITANVMPGANLEVVPGPGEFAMGCLGCPVDVLLAGSITPPPPGQPSSFSFVDDFAFLDVTVNQQPTAISVTIVSNGKEFEPDFAQTPNQEAVARVLDDAKDELALLPPPLPPGAISDLAAVFDQFNRLPEAAIPPLLDALSGESLTSFTTPRLAAKARLDREIETRVRGFASRSPGFVAERAEGPLARGSGRGLGGGMPLAGFAAGPGGAVYAFAPAEGETGLGGWIDGYGVFGTAEGSQGAADVEYGVYGTTLGVDYRLSEHVLIGAAGGYVRLETELDGRPESGHADVGQGALFAGGAWKRVHVAGWGRYAFGGYETERKIGFGLGRKAKGSFDAWEFSGHGELGVVVLERNGFELRPLGSIDYARLEQDGFTETGAISLNLSVADQSWTSLVSGAGARVQRVWELEEGLWFVPELHARWLHEFEDTDRRITPTLTGAGLTYSPFIRGAEIGRDGVLGGIGWAVSSRTGLHVFGDYEIGWNPDRLQHALKAGFQFLF